jgi:hypothetical protein
MEIEMKKMTSILLAVFISTTLAMGQGMPDPKVPQGENLNVPEGWEVRLDRPMENLVISSSPDSGDIYFVNMTPGWHVTTGPRAIFWHPENRAHMQYKVSTKLHLFNPEGRNREGYGLFFGGMNLDKDNQYYLYFLLRNTGDFLIKARKGSETETLQEWTSSDAIVKYEDESASSVVNTLSVIVEREQMKFYINEQEVATLDKGEWTTGGLFGLRVNHAVNLHVEDLGMEEMITITTEN